MDELMDMLVSKDESASQISDKIKDLLFAKSAERIENIRPEVAASIFDNSEVEAELDQDEEVEDEEEPSEEE
tara:strand:- start:84 stop:299 length:216 start_codon:yes stop_codon:yes gene_type:complete